MGILGLWAKPIWTKLGELSLLKATIMETFNIHKAKTYLSKLVDQAAKGEPFIIAKAGKQMVRVVAIDAPPEKKVQRLGFLKGHFTVPYDFNTMYQKEIEEMFYGEE